MKWPTFTLAKLAIELQPGFAQQPKGEDGGLPHMRTNNVSEDGAIDLSTIKTIAPNKEQREKYLLQPFDILFNNTNSPTLVGKTALFTEKGEFLFSNHMTRIRVRPNVANPSYIARYLHWVWRTGGFRHMVTQWVSQAAINRNQLTRLHIPLPPPSEQHRIVEILDQADTLRKKRVEANVKADRILPALFYKMFGDPTANHLRWEITTLGRARANVRYGLGQPPRLSSTGIPMIRATNIHKGQITDRDMIRVDPMEVPKDRNAFLAAEEVLVVRSGAYTGDVAQVTEKWAGSVAGYDLVVSPGQNFCGEYLETFLLLPHVQKNHFGRLKARAGQPHLNATQLLETPILLPPRPLQLAFAGMVKGVRGLSRNLETATSTLDKLFKALLYRAFSGDLTANWREAHVKELLVEMEQQSRVLAESGVTD